MLIPVLCLGLGLLPGLLPICQDTRLQLPESTVGRTLLVLSDYTQSVSEDEIGYR